MQAPEWAYTPDRQFETLEKEQYVMGEFVWTGFDYLSEPTPFYGEWPSRSSYFAIMDLAGLPKDCFYYYKSCCEKSNENAYTKNRLIWNDAVYEPGEIKVVALDSEGRALEEKVVKTAGKPAKIILSANKEEITADGDSLVFVTAKIVDEDGNF